MEIPKSFDTDIIIGLLKDRSIKSILECGCGPGYNLHWLRNELKVSVAGCDKNPTNKLVKFPFKLVDLNYGELPYKDKRFDVVLWSATLYQMKDHAIAPILEESKRVARKYIIVADFGRNYREYFPGYKIEPFTIGGWPTTNVTTECLIVCLPTS